MGIGNTHGKQIREKIKAVFSPSGYFLLAHSRLSPRSGYVSRLIGPTLPGNMKYCLRFYFSLRGEWHPENSPDERIFAKTPVCLSLSVNPVL